MQFDTSKYLEYLNEQAFGNNILYLKQTPSTNDTLWDKISNNNHMIIITDKQTHGRGRRENKWFSVESKSLTFSIGIVDEGKQFNLLPLVAALATCESINKISSIKAKIKWPNDIVVDNKKMAGILIESKIKKSKIIFNVGVGINVNLDKGDIKNSCLTGVSSMFIETNRTYSREYLLSEIVKSLNKYLTKKNEDIIKLWIKCCSHIDKKILFNNNNKNIDGIFKGINSEGYAMIKTNNKIEKFSSGIIKL